MSLKLKKLAMILISLAVIIFAVGIGSVYIPPSSVIETVCSKIFGGETDIRPTTVGIIWNLRLPRTLLAFMVGALLSVSGTVMQSVLKNPLASSYTLGVSAGAAFGVGLAVFSGVQVLLPGIFTLPLIGLICGVLTVVLAVSLTAKMDKSMGNNTIVLVGMVFSLFINAMLTLISSLSGETLQKMIRWQMGSFSLKEWSFVLILFPVTVIGICILTGLSRELDSLTFGEEDAFAAGVDVKRVKWILLSLSAALTGCAVALVGVIGFVDLIAPHVVRKIFGSPHKNVVPMAAAFGGSFMVIADIAARTVVSPRELPVGAVTALIGAPFFVYIYFKREAAK